MTCPVCKASLRDSAIFCETCGQKLDKSDVIMTVTLPKNTAKKAATQQAKNQTSVAIVLGVGLLLIGIWLGSTFLSSSPAPITRDIESLSTQVPVILQTTSIPAAQTLKPGPPPVQPAPDVTPTTQPNTTGQLADPFKSSKAPDPALNPFKKKKAAPQSVEEPLDKTLRPNFKAQ